MLSISGTQDHVYLEHVEYIQYRTRCTWSMLSISGTQDQVYLEHVEYIRFQGPGVPGACRVYPVPRTRCTWSILSMSGTQDHVLLGESARKLMISKYQIKPMPRNNLNTDKKNTTDSAAWLGINIFFSGSESSYFSLCGSRSG